MLNDLLYKALLSLTLKVRRCVLSIMTSRFEMKGNHYNGGRGGNVKHGNSFDHAFHKNGGARDHATNPQQRRTPRPEGKTSAVGSVESRRMKKVYEACVVLITKNVNKELTEAQLMEEMVKLCQRNFDTTPKSEHVSSSSPQTQTSGSSSSITTTSTTTLNEHDMCAYRLTLREALQTMSESVSSDLEKCKLLYGQMIKQPQIFWAEFVVFLSNDEGSKTKWLEYVTALSSVGSNLSVLKEVCDKAKIFSDTKLFGANDSEELKVLINPSVVADLCKVSPVNETTSKYSEALNSTGTVAVTTTNAPEVKHSVVSESHSQTEEKFVAGTYSPYVVAALAMCNAHEILNFLRSKFRRLGSHVETTYTTIGNAVWVKPVAGYVRTDDDLLKTLDVLVKLGENPLQRALKDNESGNNETALASAVAKNAWTEGKSGGMSKAMASKICNMLITNAPPESLRRMCTFIFGRIAPKGDKEAADAKQSSLEKHAYEVIMLHQLCPKEASSANFSSWMRQTRCVNGKYACIEKDLTSLLKAISLTPPYNVKDLKYDFNGLAWWFKEHPAPQDPAVIIAKNLLQFVTEYKETKFIAPEIITADMKDTDYVAIPDLNDITGAILGTMYKLGYFKTDCLRLIEEKKNAKCSGLFLAHSGKTHAVTFPKMVMDVVTMTESYSSNESQLRSKYLTCLEVALGERFSFGSARRQIETLLKKHSAEKSCVGNQFSSLQLEYDDDDDA